MTTEDLAYAAGIIDGEGCILIQKRYIKGKSPIYSLRVAVSVCDECLCIWLFRKFGGTRIRNYHRGFGFKTVYRWDLGGLRAAEFLGQIFPYLVIKVQQAKLGIEFQNGIGYVGGIYLPAYALQERENQYIMMRELK